MAEEAAQESVSLCETPNLTWILAMDEGALGLCAPVEVLDMFPVRPHT